jgi:hypothetical protein
MINEVDITRMTAGLRGAWTMIVSYVVRVRSDLVVVAPDLAMPIRPFRYPCNTPQTVTP